jgi:hypothetical protein
LPGPTSSVAATAIVSTHRNSAKLHKLRRNGHFLVAGVLVVECLIEIDRLLLSCRQ